mgnify:CR=1 FL=1
MILMPISDYPASSDDRSQAQVMAERKGELNQERQTVADSSLPPEQKKAAADTIDSETDDVERQRQSHLAKAARQEKQTEADAQKKADLSRAETRRRLDTQA